ncbi:hypothetical protein RvY_08300 [Ramazzottius varieornatus]|uniref:Jumping translocation breakpoint protein n=1 Tax=Ramazzottius varieornatus TaxID=947166 RepID=A0A1D1VDI3_RAMVA|nr:hypothetical protein RvY_08300 [Ramazzottius varieornatus]
MLARLTQLLREAVSSLSTFCSFRRFLIISGTVLVFLIFFYIKYATDLVSLSSQTAIPTTKSLSGGAPEIPRLNDSLVDKIAVIFPPATASTVGISSQVVESCGTGKVLQVEGSCRLCTMFEVTSKASFCQQTGYKEPFRCVASSKHVDEKDSSTVYWRTCENTLEIEARNFQIFGVVACAAALILSAFVYWRHHALNQQYIKKIQQRLNTS